MGFSVFVLTWNIDGKTPRGGELSELLRRNPSPDIYAIGLQELEDKEKERSYSSYYSSRDRDDKKNEKELEWVQCLDNTLPGYVRITTAKLDGIVLFIYIQQILTPVLENLETKSCGLYSRSENGPKGAIAAKFEMGGISYCFVNCHLSSQSDTLEKRNQEYFVIWDVVKFQNGSCIFDHDHVFMLGILNHRAERGEIFEGFIEGETEIQNRNSEEEDSPGYGHFSGRRRPEEHGKIPGGCDRILYKGLKGAFTVEEYQPNSYFRLSEHKPVTGFYRFKFPSYVEIKNSVAWNT